MPRAIPLAFYVLDIRSESTGIQAVQQITREQIPNGMQNHYRKLVARKTQILSDTMGKLDTLAAMDNAAAEDLGPVSHDQFVALQLNRIEFQQLKLIVVALLRLRSGDYGVCLDCGRTISARRLEAIPWAARCVTCEEIFASNSESEDIARVAA